MKIPGWGQCASVRGGHGDVPAHSSPSRARWLGMRLLVLTVLLSMMGAHGAWADTTVAEYVVEADGEGKQNQEVWHWASTCNVVCNNVATATGKYTVDNLDFYKLEGANGTTITNDGYIKFVNSDNVIKAGDVIVITCCSAYNGGGAGRFKIDGNFTDYLNVSTDHYDEVRYTLPSVTNEVKIERDGSGTPFINKITVVRPDKAAAPTISLNGNWMTITNPNGSGTTYYKCTLKKNGTIGSSLIDDSFTGASKSLYLPYGEYPAGWIQAQVGGISGKTNSDVYAHDAVSNMPTAPEYTQRGRVVTLTVHNVSELPGYKIRDDAPENYTNNYPCYWVGEKSGNATIGQRTTNITVPADKDQVIAYHCVVCPKQATPGGEISDTYPASAEITIKLVEKPQFTISDDGSFNPTNYSSDYNYYYTTDGNDPTTSSSVLNYYNKLNPGYYASVKLMAASKDGKQWSEVAEVTNVTVQSPATATSVKVGIQTFSMSNFTDRVLTIDENHCYYGKPEIKVYFDNGTTQNLTPTENSTDITAERTATFNSGGQTYTIKYKYLFFSDGTITPVSNTTATTWDFSNLTNWPKGYIVSATNGKSEGYDVENGNGDIHFKATSENYMQVNNRNLNNQYLCFFNEGTRSGYRVAVISVQGSGTLTITGSGKGGRNYKVLTGNNGTLLRTIEVPRNNGTVSVNYKKNEATTIAIMPAQNVSDEHTIKSLVWTPTTDFPIGTPSVSDITFEGFNLENTPSVTVDAWNSDEYTVSYTSNNTNVVKVENGKLVSVGSGSTTVRATVTANVGGSTAYTDFNVKVINAVSTPTTWSGNMGFANGAHNYDGLNSSENLWIYRRSINATVSDNGIEWSSWKAGLNFVVEKKGIITVKTSTPNLVIEANGVQLRLKQVEMEDGSFEYSTDYTGDVPANIYMYAGGKSNSDAVPFSISEVSFMPYGDAVADLNAYTTGPEQPRTWNGDSFGQGGEIGFVLNNVKNNNDGTDNYIRLVADGSHKIAIKDISTIQSDYTKTFNTEGINRKPFYFVNESSISAGQIMFRATVPGKVTVKARGAYSDNNFSETTTTLETSNYVNSQTGTGTAVIDWYSGTKSVAKSELEDAQPGDVLVVALKSRGTMTRDDNGTQVSYNPYISLRKASWWADFSKKYVTESVKITKTSDSGILGYQAFDDHNGCNLGTTADADFSYWHIPLAQGMLEEIREAGTLQFTGCAIEIGDVQLIRKSGATDAQLSVTTGSGPALDLQPIMSTYTKEIRFYTEDENRCVYIGGTPNTIIESITWEPGNETADLDNLVPVTGKTVWNKANQFGNFDYPTSGINAGRAITANELNPGRVSSDPEKNVPANTLLIFNEDNRETNFTNSSLISLHKVPHFLDSDGARSNVCAIKVNGPGVLRILAWGTGPSGRDLEVTREPNKNTASCSIFRSDYSGNGVQEHHLNWPRHQYSTYREIYAKVDVKKDQIQPLYIWGEVHIEEIRWIPAGEEWTVGDRTYYGDFEKYNLTEENCLTITKPNASDKGGNIIINPDRVAADRDKNNYGADGFIFYNKDDDGNSFTFEVQVYDSKMDDAAKAVPADKKQPIFTTSQDGRPNGVYDNMIESIHNLKPAGTDDVNRKVTTYTQGINLKNYDNPSAQKAGVVYVTAGTYEGNRSQTRRVEIAGPAEDINYLEGYIDNSPWPPVRTQRDPSAPMKTIVLTINKTGDPDAATTKLAVYPYLRAADVDDPSGMAFIKVSDPLITWEVPSTLPAEMTGEVTLSNVQQKSDYYANAPYNYDWSDIDVTGTKAGETIVRAKTVNGHYIDFKIIVLDASKLYLERINPVETGSVSVTENIVYKATGNIYKNGTDNSNGYADLPICVTFKDENNVEHKVVVNSKVTERNGEFYVTYDIVEALKNSGLQTGGPDYTQMEYDTDHDVHFIHPSNTDTSNGGTTGANDNDRLTWTDKDGNNIIDDNDDAQPDFVFHTIPNPSDYKQETFVYNVLQRTKDDINEDLSTGRLLSENMPSNSSDGWWCNHRSLIYIENYKNVSNNYLSSTSDNESKITILPQDPNKANGEYPLEEAIHSIEINCNAANKNADNALYFYEGTLNESTGKVDWTLKAVKYANKENGYSAVWTPSSPQRYVQIKAGGKDVNIDQLKINYYAHPSGYHNLYKNFQEYTEDSFANAMANRAGLVIKTDANNSSLADNAAVIMNVKEEQSGDIRHFALRCEYQRDETDGYNRGEVNGDIKNAWKNVMVIRDDKTDPCVMQFRTADNKAKIAYIEFVIEHDERNGYDEARTLYCTSDPRQNQTFGITGSEAIIGYPLYEREYDLVHDPASEALFGNDTHNLRRLIYCPESPTNYATFAMNADEPGYLFVRGIIVRLENIAKTNTYQLIAANANSSEPLDVRSVPLPTTGIKFSKNVTDAKRDEKNTPEESSKLYLMRRTSMRNNLTTEVALAATSATNEETLTDYDITLTRNGQASNGSSTYLHNKNYTVRLLNKNRIVIRQFGFRSEQNQKPEIKHVNSNKTNVDLRANEPMKGNQRDHAVKISVANGTHRPENKLIVYSLDGTEPKVYFSADGRTIRDIEVGCDFAAGPDVTITGDQIEDIMNHNNNNNSFVVKALALPLTGSAEEFVKYWKNWDDCEVYTYGEPSEITRAYYTFVDNKTYMTTANRDEAGNLTVDLSGTGYGSYASYITGYDIKAESLGDEWNPVNAKGSTLVSLNASTAEKDRLMADKFHAAYAPLKDVKELQKLGSDGEKKGMLTYGGYELWQKSTTNEPSTQSSDDEIPGTLNHKILTNDYWMVKTNDLTPWRGVSAAVAGDAYIVSNIIPMTEKATWGGSGKVGQEGFSAGEIGYAKNTEAYEGATNIRGWQGEFSSRKMESINPDEAYKKTWMLPCYGDYFQFEPEASGKLTVYVKQEGVMEQNNGKLDDVVIYARPVFIYDEAGNTPAGITATTTSKVSGDWMTVTHTVQDGSPSSTGSAVINNRYLTNAGAQALYELCDAWIKNNTSVPGKDLEYGDRAEKPQGVINFYGRQGEGNYAGVDEKLNTILGAYPNRSVEPNGFVTVSTGYVKYEFDVKPGKSYFMFAQSGNLGLCSYTFDATRNYEAEDVTYAISETDETKVITRSGGSAALSTMKTAQIPCNVTVPRTFSADKWSALVLPFSVGKQQLRRIFGDGVEVVHFDKLTTLDNLLLHKHVHQLVVAGVPVFIRPSKTAVNPQFRNVTIEKDETDGVQTILATSTPANSTSGGYQCVGFFKKTNHPLKRNAWYVGTSGKFSRRTSQVAQNINATIPIIEPIGSEDVAVLKTPVVGYNRIIEDGNDGQATAIDVIDNSELDNNSSATSSTMFNNNVYDAAGRLVRKNTTNLQGLPAGVYIVNGVKQVIK